MIDFLFHTFWGGVLATEIVHVVGTAVFLRLAKGSACDRPSHQVSPSCPIGTTERAEENAALKLNRVLMIRRPANSRTQPATRKVVSLAVCKIRKLKGRDIPGPRAA